MTDEFVKKFGDNCVHYEPQPGEDGKRKEIRRHPADEPCNPNQKAASKDVPQQVFNARQSALKDAEPYSAGNYEVCLIVAEKFEKWLLRAAAS